ncbi:sensor histidine kinase [Salipiger abyssi]|uniref:sensor histidine kinase n=1 Tax=Salipiger abyssi TaxID=1250539 RepID=UPI004058B28E
MADGAGKLPGTGVAASPPVDYAQIRRFEAPFANRRYLRHVILGLCCLLFWRTYGSALLPLWFAVFMLAQFAYALVLRGLPESGPPLLMWRVLIMQTLNSLLFCLPGLSLWIAGDMQAWLYSLLFLTAGGLNALAMRAHLRAALRIDLAVITGAVLVRVGWLLWQAPYAPDSWMLAVAMLALYGVFMKAAFDLRGMRAQLQAHIAERDARERQRALSQFTGGVAHDFNNLLTVVLGNMELARLSVAPDERDALMTEAERAARRGAELTTQLLALSRNARLSPVAQLPASLLETVAGRARRELLGPWHRVTLRVAPGLRPVYADPEKLHSALLELIGNARDAMPSGGEIVLTAKPCPHGDGSALRFGIADEGSGIPEHLRDKVFEPYFTTKPRGQGSGLGLPMVRGFVEQSNGKMTVEPREGGGMQIWLDLPVAQASAAPGSGASGSGEARP